MKFRRRVRAAPLLTGALSLLLACTSDDPSDPGDAPDGDVGGLDDAGPDGGTEPGADGGGNDASSDSGEPGSDGGPLDGGGDDAGTPDAGDAGPPCADNVFGWCPKGLECACCPTRGPQQSCLCSTECTNDIECSDPVRSVCAQPDAGLMGFCAPPDFDCCWSCS